MCGALHSKRFDRGSCVRHGRLIHPVSHPTRPVIPGRVFFLHQSKEITATAARSGARHSPPDFGRGSAL